MKRWQSGIKKKTFLTIWYFFESSSTTWVSCKVCLGVYSLVISSFLISNIQLSLNLAQSGAQVFCILFTFVQINPQATKKLQNRECMYFVHVRFKKTILDVLLFWYRPHSLAKVCFLKTEKKESLSPLDRFWEVGIKENE